MRTIFVLLFVAFAYVVSNANALPLDDVPLDHIRVKRATCDLIGGVAGDRACAGHCIARGFRGGWCDGRKVCNCRK